MTDGIVQTLTVPGHVGQVPRVRAFIAGVLAARGLPGDTACLLGNELVTNSVQHSISGRPGGTITVTLIAAPTGIVVKVTDDGGGGIPVLCDQGDLCAERGRGLQLVATLSTRWGYQRTRGKLTTWFQVPAAEAGEADPAGPPAEPGRLLPCHPAEPAAGTFRTADGLDADLFNLDHYPVRATCQGCGQQIEADRFLRPFRHIPGEPV